MGYGILDIGGQTRQQAMAGMDDAAKLENQREAANKQLSAAKKQQTMSNIGTGAAVGMMAGAKAGSVGGPWGAAIGAGVGLIASMF
jgi:hypothetical protein